MAKRVFLIGQAPPQKPSEEPFGRTRLFLWLAEAGISKEEALQCINFTALVDKFPGVSAHGHKAPSAKDISSFRPSLLRSLSRSSPELIIPVGVSAIREVLCFDKVELPTIIGRKFKMVPFGHGQRQITIIPLPHPSGANPWIYMADNRQKLNLALRLIASEWGRIEKQ